MYINGCIKTLFTMTVKPLTSLLSNLQTSVSIP